MVSCSVRFGLSFKTFKRFGSKSFEFETPELLTITFSNKSSYCSTLIYMIVTLNMASFSKITALGSATICDIGIQE